MEHNSSEKVVVVAAKDKKDLTWKWSVGIVAIFAIVVLIFIKLQNENFEWRLFYIIAGILSVVSIILFFGFSISKKLQEATNKDEIIHLPKIATSDAIKALILDTVSSLEYQNHVKKWISSKKRVGSVGDTVYAFEIEPEYKDFSNEIWFVIVNANLINELPTVLTGMDSKKSNSSIVGSQVNKSFMKPEKEHAKSTTKFFNPLTQTYSETQSDIVDDEKDDKATKVEADLA